MTDGIQRRLTTFVAADIAGFSRLVGIYEEGTLAAQRRKFPSPVLRGRAVFHADPARRQLCEEWQNISAPYLLTDNNLIIFNNVVDLNDVLRDIYADCDNVVYVWLLFCRFLRHRDLLTSRCRGRSRPQHHKETFAAI